MMMSRNFVTTATINISHHCAHEHAQPPAKGMHIRVNEVLAGTIHEAVIIKVPKHGTSLSRLRIKQIIKLLSTHSVLSLLSIPSIE